MADDKLMCGFDEAWVGRCRNGIPCPRHADKRCYCGEAGTRECSVASSFVCGYVTCEEHGCPCVSAGLTGSSGHAHSRDGVRQRREWEEENGRG